MELGDGAKVLALLLVQARVHVFLEGRAFGVHDPGHVLFLELVEQRALFVARRRRRIFGVAERRRGKEEHPVRESGSWNRRKIAIAYREGVRERVIIVERRGIVVTERALALGVR